LQIVLDSPAFYVGALGSQKTQANRRRRLLESGLTPQQLDRLHGPIGLEIGSQTPEEIALAVMAEIVAVKHASIG
jgi:xanthine dehydrogenase accessory factor